MGNLFLGFRLFEFFLRTFFLWIFFLGIRLSAIFFWDFFGGSQADEGIFLWICPWKDTFIYPIQNIVYIAPLRLWYLWNTNMSVSQPILAKKGENHKNNHLNNIWSIILPVIVLKNYFIWLCLLFKKDYRLTFFSLYWFVFVYIKVFGNMMLDPDSSLNRHNNFQTFFGGLLLLFR